ncbi:MAG: hypothetical protein U5L96_02930 [Owenweeksia sp.]|nr:hypothetical protein [Owenweeksia sp.]
MAVTNATLLTHTVSVPAGGKQTLILNQPLTPGTYRMGGTTINNAGGLQRTSTGASYPYISSDGSVTITGNTFNATYYYFFYNWVLGVGGCTKPDGEITIYNSGQAVVPSFTNNPGTPVSGSQPVTFDASATQGATYL